MINVSIQSDLNFPELDFTEDLADIAQRIFIPIMQQNIEDGIAIDGSSFPELEKSTIKRKQRLGQGDKTLIATRDLIESFYSSAISRNTVVIALNYGRSAIGSYLQIAGIRSKAGTKYFNFFGVNQDMEDNAVEYMKARITDAIANA